MQAALRHGPGIHRHGSSIKLFLSPSRARIVTALVHAWRLRGLKEEVRYIRRVLVEGRKGSEISSSINLLLGIARASCPLLRCIV